MISENRKEIIDGMLTKEQKQFMKQMKKFPSVLRTEYALALLHDKDNVKAEQIKSLFEKCAKSYPYQNDIESERDLIKIAEGKAKAIKVSTLAKLCEALDCQPGDLLEYKRNNN